MNDIWLTWRVDDARTEQRQAGEEGRDLRPVQAELDQLTVAGAEKSPDYQARLDAVMDRIQTLPRRHDYTWDEPSDLPAIHAARPAGPRRMELKADDKTLADKIHGAWLGRCCGCLLGKPVEGVRTPELHGLIRSTGAATITDYLWRMNPTPEACAAAGRGWLPDFGKSIAHMPIDDDTNYTIIGMVALQRHGLELTPEKMAGVWMSTMPVLACCTAERVAYRNFLNQVSPPKSASLRNPYREWIGAQIRADFFGYVALGRPQLAADLAWRDACMSHVRNGIYGEMWVAAMLAAAAGENDVRRIIDIGLSEVPAQSRLAQAVRDVQAWQAEGASYDEACRRLHAQWNEHDPHHWCHTISNAQIVAIGLLWAENDFEKGITRAVWPGFDTDCNGATVGSILGMILGARALPTKWTQVLHDTIHTSVAGYNVAGISATAQEMFELYRKHR